MSNTSSGLSYVGFSAPNLLRMFFLNKIKLSEFFWFNELDEVESNRAEIHGRIFCQSPSSQRRREKVVNLLSRVHRFVNLWEIPKFNNEFLSCCLSFSSWNFIHFQGKTKDNKH